MRKSRNGFTLVELSIVLVIIGLLIGGILVAQSMISAANITATVKQIGQFDAGVENFETKYGYLPGDAPAFGGNGDGLIDWATADPTAPTVVSGFVCEIANFWNDVDPQDFPSRLLKKGAPQHLLHFWQQSDVSWVILT
jgi:prepilin-type N-terminal cleavage/methylation domain-containing protein